MDKCSPEKLSKWISHYLIQSKVAKDIPESNVLQMCREAAAVYYREDRLMASGLIEAFKSEYGIEPSVLLSFFRKLKEREGEIGIEIVVPQGRGEPSSPAVSEGPAASVPVPSAAPPERDDDLSEAIGSVPETEARTGSEKVASGFNFNMPAPNCADPSRSLSGFLNNEAYMEWAILDRVHQKESPKIYIIEKVLVDKLVLSDPEASLLQSSDARPGGAADSIAQWILKLNGFVMAYAAARLITVGKSINYKPQEWSQAVRQIDAKVDKLTPTLLARYSLAKKEGQKGVEALQSAWNRLRSTRETMEPLKKRVQEQASGAGTEPGVEITDSRKKKKPDLDTSVPKAEKSGPDGLLSRRSLPILIVSSIIVLAAVVWGLWSIGLFQSSELKTVEIDLSGAPIKIVAVKALQKAAVVEVDDKEWKAMKEADKVKTVEKLHDKATQAGYETVQLRSGTNGVLAQSYAGGKVKIFK